MMKIPIVFPPTNLKFVHYWLQVANFVSLADQSSRLRKFAVPGLMVIEKAYNLVWIAKLYNKQSLQRWHTKVARQVEWVLADKPEF